MVRLTIEREARGLSRSRLSQVAQVNVTALADFEHGRRKPYPKAVEAVARALDWKGDPAELFAEVTDTERATA